MKRVVFILLTLSLLLCAEAVTLLATRAATRQLPVKVQSLGFYYKLDEKARYLDLKTRWQGENRGELKPDKANELALEAYNTASVESPLDMWRYQGGPAPKIFSSKIHLYNGGREALLNVPLRVTLRAKVGDLHVKPSIQMTDYQHLNRSARWETVSERTVTVPALAPGEDLRVEVGRFELLNFLARHPNRWPTELEVVVRLPHAATSRKALTLLPDHFVVPVLY